MVGNTYGPCRWFLRFLWIWVRRWRMSRCRPQKHFHFGTRAFAAAVILPIMRIGGGSSSSSVWRRLYIYSPAICFGGRSGVSSGSCKLGLKSWRMAELSWVFGKDSCHFVDVTVQFGPASVLRGTALWWDRDEAVNSCNMHTLVHMKWMSHTLDIHVLAVTYSHNVTQHFPCLLSGLVCCIRWGRGRSQRVSVFWFRFSLSTSYNCASKFDTYKRKLCKFP